MSAIIDFVSQLLETKPSLEWVGHDLYCFSAAESTVAVQETIKAATNAQGFLHHWTNFAVGRLPPFFPTATGVLLTSIGIVLLKKRRSGNDGGRNEEMNLRDCAKNFEESIRRSFKNQSDRTISILEGIIQRIPNEEPELLLFFTSEESNVTALKLAIKLMRLIFLAKGEDKKLDEIEQEHVASGAWYNRYTISYHFLKELETALTQKTGIIISDFQSVHPYSAALMMFQTRDLLSSAKGTYLFLIINTENALDDIAPEVSPEDAAMTWWLTQKLGPDFRPEVLERIQKEQGECSCVIWKEPLSTIISH